MGYLEHPQTECPPGHYWAMIRVERDERYGVRVWPEMSTAQRIQTAYYQETCPMGQNVKKRTGDPDIIIDKPEPEPVELHQLALGEHFRFPKGSTVYVLTKQPRPYAVEGKHYGRCLIVGRPGQMNEYTFPPGKPVIRLRLTGANFTEA